MYKKTVIATGQRTKKWLNQVASLVADQGSSTPTKSLEKFVWLPIVELLTFRVNLNFNVKDSLNT